MGESLLLAEDDEEGESVVVEGSAFVELVGPWEDSWCRGREGGREG